MPDALVEAAAEHGFALFEVPYELPFIALTEKAFTHLVNEQYAVLRRALAAHERLERIVLSEQGLDGVAAALSALIGGPALVFDGRGEELASSGAEPHVVAELGAELRERARAGARRGFAPGGELEGRALALPVARATGGDDGAPQAWLVAAKDDGALSEFDRLTLHQAVTIVALELLRRRMADDTERRLAGDVLTALVSGELAGAELARRLEPFGLGDRAGMVVLAPPRQVKGAVEDALARAVRDEASAGLVAGTGRFSCALIAPPKGGDEELFALAERVRAAGHARGRAPSWPPGRAAPRSRATPGATFHEARCALEARELAGNGGRAGRSRDVPRPRLLPAAALAPGRRGAAAVLRLDPRADRGRRGRLRRRADALARGVHRVQRAVGAGGAPALLPSSHPALPHPPRGGADRPVARLRARSHRLLARAAGTRADRTLRSDREDQMKVGVPTEIKTDEYRVALTPSGVRELVEHGHEVVVQAGAGEGSAISDADYAEQGAEILPDAAAVFGAADMIVKVKEPQAARGGAARAAAHALHLPAPRARPRAHARAWSSPARRASPTRRSRTRAGGSRCWRR